MNESHNFWDTIKRSNLWIKGKDKGEGIETKGIENIFNESKNFTNLWKEMGNKV
jgi:hypothetical protein